MLHPILWLSVPQSTRATIAKQLGLVRSGTTEVFDNVVVSDGYRPTDLQVVTVKRLQEHLGMPKEQDFMKLWDTLVAKAEGRDPAAAPKVREKTMDEKLAEMEELSNPTNAHGPKNH